MRAYRTRGAGERIQLLLHAWGGRGIERSGIDPCGLSLLAWRPANQIQCMRVPNGALGEMTKLDTHQILDLDRLDPATIDYRPWGSQRK